MTILTRIYFIVVSLEFTLKATTYGGSRIDINDAQYTPLGTNTLSCSVVLFSSHATSVKQIQHFITKTVG